MKKKSIISGKKNNCIVDTIIKNAPVEKTILGKEKEILLTRLKKKYSK